MKLLGALGRAVLATFEAVGQFAGLRMLLAATLGVAVAWIAQLLRRAGRGGKAAQEL